MEKIKVAIIDDHNVLRQSLAKMFNMEFDMEVIGHWKKFSDAIEFLSSNPCDVVIMDLKMPGINGIEATRRLKEIDPTTKVIVLSAYSDDEDVFSSIEAGVMGYLPKEVTVEELVEAIRNVYRGYAQLDPSITRKVLERYSGMEKKLKKVDELSGLELKILSLAAEGNSNKQIAHQLDVKLTAVKFHFREIFKKLGAKDRANAVAIAYKEGLIE